jgi:hypothetical protein
MSSKLAKLQAKIAAMQEEKAKREREEKEQEAELERQLEVEVALEAERKRKVEEAVREAEQKKEEAEKKKLAAEQRKREEERKRASEVEKGSRPKAKGAISVAVKPRPKGKEKGKAREASPMETNLERFGDGPAESDDTVLLAMEASRNQAETDQVWRRAGESSKRKSREMSEDSEVVGSSKRVRMDATTIVVCDK